MTPWLCLGLSYDNQIWSRDSFQEGIGVYKIHCPTSTVTLFSEGGEGRIYSSPVTERQKSQLTLELLFTIIHATLDTEVRCPEGSCCIFTTHNPISTGVSFPPPTQ